MYYLRFPGGTSALDVVTLRIPRLIPKQNYFTHVTACIWNDPDFGKAYGVTNAM